MYWIYILKCENEHYYVGQTKRLYRRFWEHFGCEGKGGINTSTYKPIDIIAVYKLNTLGKFFEYNKNYNKWILIKFDEDTMNYDHLNIEIETNIAERLMLHNKEQWSKIRGGKYVRFDCNYTFPINDILLDLPICNCGLPCDIKKNNEKNYLYFRCAKKNIWEKFKQDFDIQEEPCNFYQEYNKDLNFKLEESKKFEERKSNLKDLIKKSFWLKNVPAGDVECLLCDKEDCSKVIYNGMELSLCYDCFIKNNEDLKEEFENNETKCLIKIK